jgi:plastocyanin
VALLVGGLACIAAASLVFVRATSSPSEHRYVVTAGTGQRIDAGEDVEIVPAELHLHRGDRFTITNEDDRTHEIGVLSVRPNETATYAFPNRGVFRGACTVHTAGTLTVYVE